MPSGVVADAHLHRAVYLTAFAPLDTFPFRRISIIGIPPVNVEADPPAMSLLARRDLSPALYAPVKASRRDSMICTTRV